MKLKKSLIAGLFGLLLVGCVSTDELYDPIAEVKPASNKHETGNPMSTPDIAIIEITDEIKL